MKKLFSLLLCSFVLLYSIALAEDSAYTSYEEYSLNGFSYDIPSALSETFHAEDSFNLHAIDSAQTITVSYLPFDGLSTIVSSDSIFCDMCSYVYNATFSDDPSVGLPHLFTPSDGFINAAIITSKNELYYFAATNDVMIMVNTQGYSSSIDIQLAFMQIVTSLSPTIE